MGNFDVEVYKREIEFKRNEIIRNKLELKSLLRRFLVARYGAKDINTNTVGFDFTIDDDKSLLCFLHDIREADISLTYWKNNRISILDQSDLIKIINCFRLS